MSIQRTVDIKCPGCGRRTQSTVWDTLNVSLDPEAKADLLAGKLNAFHCDACGLETQLDAIFLYHDMEREFLVQYYPFRNTDGADFLGGFGSDGQPDLFGTGAVQVPAYFKNQHVVFDMDELVRYVTFRDRLFEHRSTRSNRNG